MPARAAFVDDTTVRASARVATIAAELDTDPSQVRRLIDAGEFEAHTIGKRGVRIYRDSVEAYQRRQARAGKAKCHPVPPARTTPTAASRAAIRAAIATLQKAGVLVDTPG